MRRAYLQLDHGQLHYRESGERAGVPWLLLHQSPSDSRMYEKLAAALGESRWIVAPDNPGFGGSDPLPGGFTLAACASAILNLLDALHIDQCYLFGHHTGASIAAQLADLAPQRFVRIALCGPTLLGPELKAALPGKAEAFPVDADGSHLSAMWRRMAAKEAGADPDLLLREVGSAFAAGSAYKEAYQAVAQQDFEMLLRGLSQPTLVFAGTEDILYPQLAPSLACLQQGELAEIEGAGSYICETRPVEIAALLREFFQDA